jgi:hypothetical protein
MERIYGLPEMALDNVAYAVGIDMVVNVKVVAKRVWYGGPRFQMMN